MSATTRSLRRTTIEILILAVLVFLCARLGVALIGSNQKVSPLWPASGMALAGLWILGPSRWPAIVLGTMASDFLSGNPILVVLTGPWANCAEALAAFWLARRAGLRLPFTRPIDIPKFLFFACALPPVISGAWNVGVLCASDVVPWDAFAKMFALWWLGNSQGILLVAPAGIALGLLAKKSEGHNRGECAFFVLLAALTTAAAFAVPGGSILSYPLSWTAFAVVLWAAFRQGFSGAALATCSAMAVATGANILGQGIFIHTDPSENASLLIVFNMVLATTGLLVAAVNNERLEQQKSLHESESQIRKLHESMRDAFVSVDMAGRIQDYNQAYLDIVGYRAGEVAALTYQGITPQKWRPMEDAIVRDQILPLGCSEVYEKEYRRKDGSLVPVELRAFLLRNDVGEPTGIWAIVRDISERKKMEAQAKRALRNEAEWLQLRIQSQPHLLFNTLTSLRALIRADPDQAVEFATKLARFLRSSLKIDQRYLVSLESELELACSYLEVEHFRFSERLRWRIEVPADLLAVELPPLVLLTLVENAVKHSIAHRIEGGEIVITAGRRDGGIFLRVKNPGRIADHGLTSTGIGLRNTRDRLQLFLGTDAALELQESGSGVLAEVRIPARSAGGGPGVEKEA